MDLEKENVEPCSRKASVPMSMKPLEVRRLIHENTPSSTPNVAPSCRRSPLKSLSSYRSTDNLSSPPSASSTPYAKHEEHEHNSQLVFRTPGRLPDSASSSFNRKTRTPSGGGSCPRLNPFETRENLHLPLMSPSLFAEVQSPRSEEPEGFWTLEQRAHLFPVHVSEDSPMKQEETRKLDPESENRTQEALDRYFDEHHQITSPIDIVSSSNINDVWTQTELSLPPRLPEEVEQVLAKYGYQTSVGPEGNTSMSNMSLRRKLFTNIKGEEENDSDDEDEEEDPSSPIHLMSPGKVIYTPRGKEINNPSSPKEERMAYSVTPPLSSFHRRTSGTPSQLMASPLFSPISRSQSDIKNSGAMSSSPLESMSENVVLMRSVLTEDDEVDDENDDEKLENDGACLVSDIREDNNLQSENNSEVNVSRMDTNSASCSPVKALASMHSNSRGISNKISSTKLTLDNLTSSMTFNDVSEVTLPTNSSSSTTGYCTGNSNNQPSLSTITEVGGEITDSGVTTGDKSAHFEFFPSSSNINPPGNTARSYMVSYGVEEHGNDISVGFPLGSSTPTK